MLRAGKVMFYQVVLSQSVRAGRRATRESFLTLSFGGCSEAAVHVQLNRALFVLPKNRGKMK